VWGLDEVQDTCLSVEQECQWSGIPEADVELPQAFCIFHRGHQDEASYQIDIY
jgi:hypothetical protein